MEITLLRSIKIWWGFCWRAYVLMLPVMAIIFPLMFFVLPIPKPGEPPQPVDPSTIPGFAGKFFVIWLIMVGGMIFMQCLALRWLFKTKWSDFKLAVLPNDKNDNVL